MYTNYKIFIMHLYNMCVFLLLNKLQISQSKLVFQNKRTELDLRETSQEAFRIAVNKFFKRKNSIAVQWSNEFCLHKMLWLLNIGIPTVIGPSCNTNQSYYNLYEHFDGYIFSVSGSNKDHEVYKFLTYYYNSYAWLNKSEVFINLVERSTCKPYSETEFEYFFHRLWIEFGVLNLVVLTTYNNKCNTLVHEKVWIYNPFLTTGKRNIGIVRSFNVNENFVEYLDKRLMNMNGYPIRITMFHYIISNNNESFVSTTPVYRKGGVDVSFKWLMASYFNFTPVVHEPYDGDTYGYLNNGSYTGLVGEIQRLLTDMTLNCKFIRWYNVNNIYYTYSAYRNSLCVIVRKSSQVTGWDIIVKTFHWKVWITMIVISILSCIFSILFWFIENHDTKDITFFSLIDITSIIWKPLLSASVINIPQGWTLRILMGSCFLCGTVIVTVILGQIYTSVRVRQYYPDINTLEDLYNSGLDVLVNYNGIIDVFDGYESKVMVGLNKRVKLDPECAKDILKYLQENNVAILTSDLTLRYQEITNLNAFKTTLHYVKECPQHYNLGYMLPRGSVYYEAINTLVSRVHDAGLFGLWLQDLYAYRKESTLNTSVSVKSENIFETSNIRMLTYDDLELHFFLLYCGLTVSLFVFVLEILWYRMKQYMCKHKF